MSTGTNSKSEAQTRASVAGYYRLHSKIYDATRWTFLFGRNAVLHEVATFASPQRILEVGCGTGKNLTALNRLFPQAEITGVDLSETMLEVARRKTAKSGSRVRLEHGAYGPDFASHASYDLVFFSYALSMFNPGFEDAITSATRHLTGDGYLAVVDFHDTRWPVFARWMAVNHVRMDGQIRPLLTQDFKPCLSTTRTAYGGLWRYFLHIGQKKPDAAAFG